MQLGLFDELPAAKEEMHPDLAARKILVAAYLYYVLDAPTMTDGEYDKLSIIAADGWNRLETVRQWMLGDPDSARSGGSHFKFNTYVVGAARTLHLQVHRRPTTRPYPENWQWCEEHRVHYVTAIGG
jgi:hypothetical protein